MASQDGSRSYLAGSDELIEHTCGPCKDDGETKEGKYFCEFCKVYLCYDCRNDHKTFKATKNHSIVSAHLTHGAGSTSSKSAFTTFILDMKVTSTKEVDIRLPDDERTPLISGCTFLSNGRILLCDWNNNKMKLLDSDMSFKKSLKLSARPYNVAAVGENEAIITFSDMKNNDLQFIDTHPDLKLAKTITLPGKCYGLQVVNDEIYTTCHKGSGNDDIWRLDRAGNIMSKIVLTQSSSRGSGYLGLCLTGPSPRVYLTDGYDHKVTCFQLDGKMVYQYQDEQQLGCPEGIYVDSAGNSLVCGAASHNIVIITADGRKHGELMTATDLRHPKCIDYRPEDDTLIGGYFVDSKLFVCKLGR